jgi:hypothetical protein
MVLGLYLLAYVCNLLATPIDDQLTFEARRDVGYWALPLQQAFVKKVGWPESSTAARCVRFQHSTSMLSWQPA